MNKLPTVNLADALSREIVRAVQAAMRPTAAFCLVVAGRDKRSDGGGCAATGWLWNDGDIEPLRDRHISLLLPAALRDGVRVSHIALIDGHDQLLLAAFEVQSMRVCMGVAHRGRSPDPC